MLEYDWLTVGYRTGYPSVPVLCGTNTGHHMLLDTVAGDTMELEVDGRYI